MKKHIRLIICFLIILLLTSVIIFSMTVLFDGSHEYPQPSVPSETPEVSSDTSDLDGVYMEPVIDFKSLQEKNDEIYAWIYIPDTKINYPVVQSETDLGFYLKHDENKKADIAGAIFTENRNTKTFEDYNTVLYGHYMSNGSMFSNIHKYLKKDFFDAHREIYIYTPEKAYKYTTFALYIADDSHVLFANDFSTEQGYQAFLDKIMAQTEGNYDKTLDITTEDRLITLSTCYDNGKSRILLIAVLDQTIEYIK